MCLKFIVILIFVSHIGFNGECQENSDKKDSNLIRVVLNNSFSEKETYKSLPSCVRQYLNKINGGKFTITRGAFSETDVIKNNKLPSRHLLYTGDFKNYYILSYEHGGRGKHQHVLIMDVQDRAVKKMVNITTQFHNDLSGLIKIIENEKFTIQTTLEF